MNQQEDEDSIKPLLYKGGLKKISLLLVFIFVFDFILLPISTNAIVNDTMHSNKVNQKSVFNTVNFEKGLPISDDLIVDYTKKFVITAYNSESSQCDDTPCITANGFDVCKHNTEDTIATNVLPFGTKIKIPSLFGDRVFVVRDRMNDRYTNRIDVWMRKKSHAKMFGIQYAEVEILDYQKGYY